MLALPATYAQYPYTPAASDWGYKVLALAPQAQPPYTPAASGQAYNPSASATHAQHAYTPAVAGQAYNPLALAHQAQYPYTPATSGQASNHVDESSGIEGFNLPSSTRKGFAAWNIPGLTSMRLSRTSYIVSGEKSKKGVRRVSDKDAGAVYVPWTVECKETHDPKFVEVDLTQAGWAHLFAARRPYVCKSCLAKGVTSFRWFRHHSTLTSHLKSAGHIKNRAGTFDKEPFRPATYAEIANELANGRIAEWIDNKSVLRKL